MLPCSISSISTREYWRIDTKVGLRVLFFGGLVLGIVWSRAWKCPSNSARKGSADPDRDLPIPSERANLSQFYLRRIRLYTLPSLQRLVPNRRRRLNLLIHRRGSLPYTSPNARAFATASVRRSTCNLSKITRLCPFTVLKARKSFVLIS